MTTERREVKATLSADETGAVTGVAWPFGEPDAVGDLIEPTAFHFADKVPMVVEHDQRHVVGIWDSMAVTDTGLEVKGSLFVDGVAPAREARQTMQRGLMSGLSIGYQLHEAKARPEGGRVLKSLTITEISLCRRPVHPSARVTEVKSEGNEMTTASNATNTPVVETEVKAVDLKAANDNIAALSKRLDEAETKLARPHIIRAANDNEPTAERKAFTSFLRYGQERMPHDEAKSLVVSDDARGGYLAPAEFQTEILKAIVLFSPVRQLARIGSTAASSVILPKRTGTPTANWVGEIETRTGTESSYGQVEIPVHEMAAFVDVSLQLLEDAAVNVEAEVTSDLGEEFARLEAVSFVSGDGFKKPVGFMNDPDVAFKVSGSASSIADADGQANGLIDLLYSLKPAYRANAVWTMNGSTLAAVRKLKDANKQYIWAPGAQAGEPGTLLGRPIAETVDMPDISANTFPIAVGDFNSAYRIYDRVGMSILRDPYALATTGKVRFHARRRVGAGMTQPEAIKKLKVSA